MTSGNTEEHIEITRAVFLKIIYSHYKANLSKKRKEKLQEKLVCLGLENLIVILFLPFFHLY